MSVQTFRIPVTVEIEPERLSDRDRDTAIPSEELLSQLVDRGLRGRLATRRSAYRTAVRRAQHVSGGTLNLVADASAELPELPTIPNTVEAITATIENVVARVDEVRIDEIAAALQGTLEGTEALTNAPELRDMLASLAPAMESLSGILSDVNESNIDQTLGAAQGVAISLEDTVRLVNQALQPSGPLQYNVIQMTGELEETARAIRALVEQLERQPQSVLFGRSGGD